ncbi:N-acetylmuramic acid-specific PTS system IIC component [Entomoplasma freundtii]|uniref:PTS system, N-acetylmuramic acid-specific EIIBC component n=1 Tax=Entomoplasma freundtii TaxID=74700 RepID=A0A2K8NS20_9MOLU|nr:PTS transporter subunit EIIC [Entomoplasma freundtii]ATZ16609.1 PTS system, N-acetylmuramic acid-specific EIIBC component [Entomoplasma freundtii]TDY58224.1 N-acetylmuramic acid-specific PTS system IIC component [Entomoplasma freundtii]
MANSANKQNFLVPLSQPQGPMKKRHRFNQVMSEIINPIIPAFIGAGLLGGVGNLISSFGPDNPSTVAWSNFFSLLLNLLTSLFIILIGWNAGKKFGTQAAITALIAALYCNFVALNIGQLFVLKDEYYHFLNWQIPRQDLDKYWITKGLMVINNDGSLTLGAPRAGLIGAFFAIAFAIGLEKLFNRFIKGFWQLLITPTLVMLLTLLVSFLVIIPLGYYFFTGLTWLFLHLYQNPFGAALLGGTYLMAVMFGIHQGFFPIYLMLFTSTGLNSLFPIMIMGAASQVGVGLALLIIAKKQHQKPLQEKILGALVPALFGITEPLTYGITMPRGKPLYLSCLGGFVGGFLIGALNTWFGIELGVTAPITPGGLTALLLITTSAHQTALAMLIYLVLLITMYLLGFGLGFIGYSACFRFASQKKYLESQGKQGYVKKSRYYCWYYLGGCFWYAFYLYPKLPHEEKKAWKAFVLV